MLWNCIKADNFDEWRGAQNLSRNARTFSTQVSEGFAATKPGAKLTL